MVNHFFIVDTVVDPINLDFCPSNLDLYMANNSGGVYNNHKEMRTLVKHWCVENVLPIVGHNSDQSRPMKQGLGPAKNWV